MNCNSINGLKDYDLHEDKRLMTSPTSTTAKTFDSITETMSTASKPSIPISLSSYLKGAIPTPLVAIAKNQNSINTFKDKKFSSEDKKHSLTDTNPVKDIRFNGVDEIVFNKTKGMKRFIFFCQQL